MHITPIGTFRCAETYPYDAARQGVLAEANAGTIELDPGHNYEQALQDLEGFSRIWLIFQFHRNEHWKPVVRPPRGNKKVGVFASRAPYRPNPIGMSCVRLIAVDGRTIQVAGHDLLDGTPILDIKPYIPYADAFPDATGGWTDALDGDAWQITIQPKAKEQLSWLANNGVQNLEAFLHQQLTHDPVNEKKKRVRALDEGHYEIAYRTWRITFTAIDSTITIEKIDSGYSPNELADPQDPHEDKQTHRDYIKKW